MGVRITKEKKLLIFVNVALICAQVGFGGFNVVGKYALDYVKPVVFAFYREVISGPLLLIIAAVVERVIPEKRDWWRLALLGFVLYLNQFCFIMGLKLTNSATQTAILQQCIPVFTAALTVILKMEKFTLVKLAGMIFAVAGALVMIGFQDFKLDSRTVGMLVLLCNTMFISTYYVMQKPLLKKYPPITVTGWAYMVASVSMGFTSLYYIDGNSVYAIPAQVYLPLGYAVFVQTIFGYCCVSWANTHAPASLVAVYNSLQPVVAFVLAHIFFSEVFVWNEGVGTALVIAGLAFVTWARMKESKEAANNKSEEANNTVNKRKSIHEEKAALLGPNKNINTGTSDSKKWMVYALDGTNNIQQINNSGAIINEGDIV